MVDDDWQRNIADPQFERTFLKIVAMEFPPKPVAHNCCRINRRDGTADKINGDVAKSRAAAYFAS